MEVKYLGCMVNEKCDMKNEVAASISTCMTTLKKLDAFWSHSSCPERFKISVLDAVVRAKILYGLETAEVTQAILKSWMYSSRKA